MKKLTFTTGTVEFNDVKIQVEKILDKIDIREELYKSIKESTDMQGWNNDTWLNVDSLEITRTSTSQNTSWDTSRDICLFNLVSPMDEGIRVEDFLDEEEIQHCHDNDVDCWDYINELDDYNDRLADAIIFHREADWAADWKDQLEEIIQSVRVWKRNTQEWVQVETAADMAQLYEHGFISFREGFHGCFVSFEEKNEEPIKDIDDFCEWIFDELEIRANS